jgi:hypothetical protein
VCGSLSDALAVFFETAVSAVINGEAVTPVPSGRYVPLKLQGEPAKSAIIMPAASFNKIYGNSPEKLLSVLLP